MRKIIGAFFILSLNTVFGQFDYNFSERCEINEDYTEVYNCESKPLYTKIKIDLDALRILINFGNHDYIYTITSTDKKDSDIYFYCEKENAVYVLSPTESTIIFSDDENKIVKIRFYH